MPERKKVVRISSMATLKSINPANGKFIGEVEISTEKEIVEKIANARKAQDCWNNLGIVGRGQLLKKVVENLSTLQKHLNNAYNMMGNVFSSFNQLGQKIISTQRLGDGGPKLDKKGD